MTKKPVHPQEAGPESPKKWSTREDALAHGGEYPNQNYIRTQSGHLVMMDDTKDSEHLTIQHRSGARIQFGPSGDVQLIAHNGQYSIIFGENRMEISGTQDISVKGASTLKIDGPYDLTVGGNINLSADGDFNFVGKNFNVLAGGNIDMAGKQATLKTEGSMTLDSGGAGSLVSEGDLALVSRGSSVSVVGSGSVGVVSKGGDLAFDSAGETHLKATGQILADGSQIWMNSGKSKPAADLVVGTVSPPVQVVSGRSGTRHK